jgi:hypothetical protein
MDWLPNPLVSNQNAVAVISKEYSGVALAVSVVAVGSVGIEGGDGDVRWESAITHLLSPPPL